LYSDALSQLANHAVENGYSVVFFPMQKPAIDLPCINSILRKCKYKDLCSVLDGAPETPEHIRKVAQCRLFVGHKTHSVLFALATGTPIIAIAYHQKTQDFMNHFGISQYCIPDVELSGEKLLELFSMAQSNLDEISQKELDCISKEGPRVQNDFARLIDHAKDEFK
jgi:polysaccharide pyruvyl transferase WcaK-like protein